MDPAAALVEQNRMFGEFAAAADPGLRVPTCPDWTLRQLLAHVGRGDRWAATIVRDRADGYVDIRSVADGKPPQEAGAAIEWLVESARLLLDAVAATGPDTPVWSFVGPRPASWWVRRRLHEVVVHRADAAFAVGRPYEVEPELAADGVSEWLSLVAARPAEILDPDATLHLHATDEGLGSAGEWMIRGTATGIEWEHGHGKGAAAVRGSAADLLLAVLRRIPADGARLQVLGDASLWRTWLARTPF
jgi:uncharacterized protein (TIGR03083 family)